MATENHMETGAPNLNLTHEEKRVYGQLFRQADTNNIGVVTGEVAVKFFEKTRLDSRVLGEIWQIADKENRGFLTPAGFGIVLRLIGHAQAGREPKVEVALTPGPLPRFDGIVLAPPPPAQSRPAPSPSPSNPPTPTPIMAQGPGGVTIQIPSLTSEKATQYAGLFERQTLHNGNMLPADVAKSIFEKSGLSNDVLGRIWQLADTEQRGTLVMTEFVMSMHLLTCLKSGALRSLPVILPAPLYEAATQRTASRASTGLGASQIPPIPRQLSGAAQQQTEMRTGSPLTRQPMAPPPALSPVPPQLSGPGAGPVGTQPTGMRRMPPQATGMPTSDWLVTPADKARFDKLYDSVDEARLGVISGEQAVGFFSQSNLSEDILAQIWDLADINSAGQLTREEFAVAMYLIRQQRMRTDGTNTIPAILPMNLIPPNMRAQVQTRTATTTPASAFDDPIPPPTIAAPPPQPKSAMDDLFDLTSPVPPVVPPTQAAMATGGSSASRDPFSSTSPLAPGSPVAPVSSQPTGLGAGFKPFVPSSSFGMGLHKTGESAGSAPAKLGMPAPIEEDLLGDGDPEISKKLTSETAELANMSNQVGTLSNKMQELQTKRSSTQQEFTQASTQKKMFEARLSQLRTAYEKEATEVKALQQQLEVSNKDTKKLQMDFAVLEASYNDLQGQKNQILAGLQQDQQNNATLKEKIRNVNTEITALKPQIDKLKSDARQQKGLVAINKKQLSTNEGEREKLKSEVEDLTKSNEELSRQLSTGSPASTSVQVASPTLSAASASATTNPFFRRTGSADAVTTFAAATAPAKGFNDKTFDDVFGPFAANSASSTPPPTSFKKTDTSTSSPYATPGSASPQLSRQAPAPSEPSTVSDPKQAASTFLPFQPAEPPSASPPANRLGHEATTSDFAGGPKPLSPAPTGRSIGSASGALSGSERETPKAAATFPIESQPSTLDNPFPAPSADDALKTTNTAPLAASDPFGATDTVTAKHAFDDAFASFKPTKAEPKAGGSAFDAAFDAFPAMPQDTKAGEAPAARSLDAFNAEFPPIAELERDEDSDSDIEKGGFEDDFSPASPAKNRVKDTAAGVGAPTTAEEAPKSESSTITALTQPSVLIGVASSPEPSMDNIFSSAAPTTTAATTAPATTAVEPPTVPAETPAFVDKKPQSPFDELDDFEGLEDAKEGSADDDFANISRSGLDDFNPVFDSSPPPSQAKSESTAFGAESSFDFANVSEGSGSGGQQGPGQGGVPIGTAVTTTTTATTTDTTATATTSGTDTTGGAAVAVPATDDAEGNGKAPLNPGNQEWEALFAGLDSPGSEGTATATKDGAAGGEASENNTTVVSATAATAPSNNNGATGMVTATGGEEQADDPSLMQLLAMGYERGDAVGALEKCHYDTERAIDLLLSKS